MDEDQPTALIYKDDKLFEKIYDDSYRSRFREVSVSRDWSELSLMVWKPHYECYLREQWRSR